MYVLCLLGCCYQLWQLMFHWFLIRHRRSAVLPAGVIWLLSLRLLLLHLVCSFNFSLALLYQVFFLCCTLQYIFWFELFGLMSSPPFVFLASSSVGWSPAGLSGVPSLELLRFSRLQQLLFVATILVFSFQLLRLVPGLSLVSFFIYFDANSCIVTWMVASAKVRTNSLTYRPVYFLLLEQLLYHYHQFNSVGFASLAFFWCFFLYASSNKFTWCFIRWLTLLPP